MPLPRLAGGEYRDPHFLFTYEAQTFRAFPSFFFPPLILDMLRSFARTIIGM